MPTTNEEVEQRVSELKQVLQNEYSEIFNARRHTDEALLRRFLSARQFNVKKAAEMVKANELWRRENEIDSILEWPGFPEREKVHELLPIYNHKTDKKGRPILIMQFEKCDGNELFKHVTEDRILKLLMRRMEKEDRYYLPACEAANPSSCNHQMLVITDLKGAYFSQFYTFLGVLKKFIQNDLNNYPENLGLQVFINAPYIFYAGFALIKPMLDENTISKIKVLGADYQETLLELVEKENLPSIFGGDCNSCPGGCDKACIGPWNDGSVPGYPIPEWENIELKDIDCGKVEPAIGDSGVSLVS